jgi:DNA-binding LytR/AlgR family response regulator
MKVLIIEDERPASQKFIRLLKEIDPEIEILDTLRSVEHTVNWLSGHPNPDLIFMDIQLEDGLCFEIFEKCKIDVPLIFTTAYDEYALKAFKLNSVDYLLKPVNRDELKNAIEKYHTIYRQKTYYARLESVIKQLQPPCKERFLVKIGAHYKSIPVTNIHCFYIIERCSFLFTDSNRSYPLDFSLNEIEQLVDPKLFFRINRDCIVNFFAIQDIIAYSSNRLKIILRSWTEKEELLVSRERVTDFKKWMDR